MIFLHLPLNSSSFLPLFPILPFSHHPSLLSWRKLLIWLYYRNKVIFSITCSYCNFMFPVLISKAEVYFFKKKWKHLLNTYYLPGIYLNIISNSNNPMKGKVPQNLYIWKFNSHQVIGQESSKCKSQNSLKWTKRQT